MTRAPASRAGPAPVAVPPASWSLLAGAGFLGVLALVLGGWAPLDGADSAVSGALRGYGEVRPGHVAALRVATDIMETLVFLAAGMVTTVLFARRRDWRAVRFVAAVTALVPILWALMHLALHRPRPLDGFVTVHSNGFPSGHTAHAASAALVGLLLLWPRLDRACRVAAVLVAGGFAAFIGATRVALLAHWPSDVLGGWLLALAVVPLVARAAGYSTGPGPPHTWRAASTSGQMWSRRHGRETRTGLAGRARAPSDRAPSDRAPSDRAPSDRAPSDRAPSDLAPSDLAPSDLAPDEVRHAGEPHGDHQHDTAVEQRDQPPLAEHPIEVGVLLEEGRHVGGGPAA
jgi:undecaprenyl-diphosphatase